MISKKYIKEMEFKTIEDLFNYIVESKINGNYTQTKDLIKKLSVEQRNHFKDFITYSLDLNDRDKNLYEDLINIMIGIK